MSKEYRLDCHQIAELTRQFSDAQKRYDNICKMSEEASNSGDYEKAERFFHSSLVALSYMDGMRCALSAIGYTLSANDVGDDGVYFKIIKE